jgi:hypothetical protein
MCLAVVLVFATVGVAFAQNAASNKAFFGSQGCNAQDVKAPEGCIVLASIKGGTSSEVVLFDIPAALKTSNGGAVSAILSMESVLWTFNTVTATNSGGKSSSSARAAIKAWVEIDGVPMEPGMVVYADRLQATGLTVNLACAVTVPGITGTTCVVTGDITLDLFQATKNANSFVYYAGPLAPIIHSVKVKAKGFIECRDSTGTVIACPTTTLAGFENASTMAAIGKATLLLEEQQNWGSQ